jgi:hypothetical protein
MNGIFGMTITVGEDMQRTILVFGFLLIASSVLPGSNAQNQQAPRSDPGLTADYPRDQAGILIQSTQWTVVANQSPVRTRTGRGIAASLSYGLVPAKIVSEYAGEHAPTQVETAQPIICICHLISLPGDPVLVRLHPKKGSRELDGGRMIVYPVVGGSKMADANKSDLIPADVSHPDSQVWLIRPQSPLQPGEYALMLGTQNISIFPFTILLAGPR